jgi:hypothetical protein
MCIGCFTNEQEQERRWESKLKEAKEYAAKNNVMVVAYKEHGEPKFIEADKAAAAGIQGQFISPMRSNADGGFY